MIPKIDIPKKKNISQSLTLRAVLFRLFEQNGSLGGDFEEYYKKRMDDIITICKSKLKPR
jgi:hypothetical protein